MHFSAACRALIIADMLNKFVNKTELHKHKKTWILFYAHTSLIIQFKQFSN